MRDCPGAPYTTIYFFQHNATQQQLYTNTQTSDWILLLEGDLRKTGMAHVELSLFVSDYFTCLLQLFFSLVVKVAQVLIMIISPSALCKL